MKLLFDASVYLAVLLNEEVEHRLRPVLLDHAPDLHLCAVVRAELTQGAKGRGGRALVDRLARPFERTGRIVTPDYSDWVRASTVQSKIWDTSPTLRSKRLLHDILIACCCRKIGAILVTENERDFVLIDREIRTRRMKIRDLERLR